MMVDTEELLDLHKSWRDGARWRVQKIDKFQEMVEDVKDAANELNVLFWDDEEVEDEKIKAQERLVEFERLLKRAEAYVAAPKMVDPADDVEKGVGDE